jgi:hypothetical protein
MLPQRIRRAIVSGTILCLFACDMTAASAADLDRVAPPREPGPQAWQDNGEFIPAHHGCRLIPQPQLNLYGDTTSFRPIWVCVSRGLYGDTFPPPPLPPRFLGIW